MSKVKIALSLLLGLLLILGLLPFTLPLTKAQLVAPNKGPFSNSAYYTLKNEDTYIHYRIYRSQATDPVKGTILLIHGFGGSTFSYEHLAPELADRGYNAIALDLPGFGFSSRNPLENHAQSHRAAQIWALIDHLETTTDLDLNKVHIMGHSMGGGTAAALAIERPNRLVSLMLIDPALFNSTNRRSAIFEFPVISRWLQVLLEHVIITEARIEKTLSAAYGQAPTRDQVLGYLKPLKVPGTARGAQAILTSSSTIPEETLATIGLPTLALWGEKDSWVPFTDAQRIKALLPQLEINSIPEAGHCPMETHPQAFNKLIIDWLQTHP